MKSQLLPKKTFTFKVNSKTTYRLLSSIGISAFVICLGTLINLSKSQASSKYVPLLLFWSPEREDNFVTSTPEGVRAAKEAGYGFARVEACLLKSSQYAGYEVPLNLYWSAQRGDNFSTGTEVGIKSAIEAGYSFVRRQGYMLSNKTRIGRYSPYVPLKLYWSPHRGDNFSTATAIGEKSAKEAGYGFARIEGYVLPRNYCLQEGHKLANY